MNRKGKGGTSPLEGFGSLALVMNSVVDGNEFFVFSLCSLFICSLAGGF